jgi:hypothetical protein
MYPANTYLYSQSNDKKLYTKDDQNTLSDHFDKLTR